MSFLQNNLKNEFINILLFLASYPGVEYIIVSDEKLQT